MPFKFEKLEVWQMSLDYIDLIYEIAEELPRSEEYNLKSQIRRAATSVALEHCRGFHRSDRRRTGTFPWSGYPFLAGDSSLSAPYSAAVSISRT